MNALELIHVCKTFGKVRAVDDLCLSIEAGQIYGLLGPNGAGKTTTIRMIMGIILPDHGEIVIFGERNSLKMLDKIGYLPEERGLYKKMKVKDVIQFFGELKGMKKSEIRQLASSWLERFELAKWQETKVEELSRGMQQKLQFIITIMHKPQLIILDEPFTGLDPVNTTLVKDVILELNKAGTTIIFSTHLMEQVEKLCDAICLINKGRSVLQGSLHEIKKRYGRDRIQLQYSGDDGFLNNNNLVASYDNYGNYVEIRPQPGVSPNELLKKILETAEVFRFEVVEPSLNEIFIETVKGNLEESTEN